MSYGLVIRTANIRRGPGIEFAVSGGATAGTPLTIFGRNTAGDWLQIRTPDRSGGWIHASLVRANVPIATIPVPANVPTVPTRPAPTQPPATEPPPAQPPAPPSMGTVAITHIFYDGVVYRVESDEYVEITNMGATPVNLAGWRINAGDPGQDFWFPNFVVPPGQSCRVYTNENHPESCGFSLGSGRAIWNNKGDCGHLYDAAGTEVSTRCY